MIISHDWPRGIWDYGNITELLKYKPMLKGAIRNNELASPPFMDLLKHIRPPWWFAAHHHYNFEANVAHDAAGSTGVASSASTGAAVTRFLAMDKCMPKRDGLKVNPPASVNR